MSSTQKRAILQVRIREEDKQHAEHLYDAMGTSLAEAVRLFNMSRTLSRGKIGPGPNDMGSGPLPISTRPRRPRRVFPTLVFAV